jgi:putative membrane protein
MAALSIFFKGLLMGLADVIPGVSGGTIALITGIYHRLIHAISRIEWNFIPLFVKGKFTQSRALFLTIDFPFLLPLAFGIGIAIFFFSKFIDVLLMLYTAITYAFFFGLILASALVLLKATGKLTKHKVAFLLLGALLAYVIAGVSSLHASHSLPIIFLSGLIAISAMLLPGISGSFILLLLGQYQYIITALHSYTIPVILTFSVGAMTGLLGFSKAIDKLLHHYKELTMVFLIGLMLGALRVSVTQVSGNGGFGTWVLIAGIVGFLIVLVVEKGFGR